MNILLISAFPLKMNTSGTIQNLIIIEGLKKLGHNIDVISTAINTNHIAFDPSLSLHNVDNYYELELPHLYTTFRTQKKQNKLTTVLKKSIKRVYSEFEIFDPYKKAIDDLKNIKINNKYDCVLSVSDPKSSHLLAYEIIRYYNFHLPWIQYWGDPLYLDISRKRKILFEHKVKKSEEKLISKADKVIYATPFTAEEQKVIYHKYKDKISYTTQGFWNGYSNCNIDKTDSIFKIGYFGNYNPNIRDIVPLYNTASDTDAFSLFIGGSGLELNNNKSVKILGLLNHEKISYYEKKMDLIVCILNNKGTQIPGKLYYYASFNKPILVILDGDKAEEIKDFLESFGRYDFCYNTKESINNAINNIMSRPKDYNYVLPESLKPENIALQILDGIDINE